jgi:perosamine synthetase
MERTADGVRNPASGRLVSAIVPMHTLGHPTDIVGLVALGDEWGIPVVEDAAESLGSWVGDRHTGTFGRLGVLSFNGNKIVTTGGGGMILTDDPEVGRHAKHLTTTAKVPHAWEFEHDEVGYNFRMPNINAALGVAQFERLPTFLEHKRTIAQRYADVFADVGGLTFMAEPSGTRSNYWLCAVRLDEPSLEHRDALLRASAEAGIQSRPFWNLLSEQKPYRDAQAGPLDEARALHAGVISIPSSPALANR